MPSVMTPFMRSCSPVSSAVSYTHLDVYKRQGEAREADIGVAGGDGCGLLFKKGEILRKVPEDEILPALLEEIAKL